MSVYKNISLLLLAALAVAPLPSRAQTNVGTLKGQVTDVSGSAIPGANVIVTGPRAFSKTYSTDETGTFTAIGLNPGNYGITVSKFGFANYVAKSVPVTNGKVQSLSIPLELQANKQEVTVAADAVGTLAVDPTQNAGQLVLKGEDLEALPDDPDDLAADLQALAGPSAGPNGGQIYIDGFTGGNLPPKSSIREIRINSNPFSAEYDRLGFGRIEILTRPGTDRYRGSVMFNDSDNIFNARNPFLVGTNSAALNATPGVNGAASTLSPDFKSRMYGGNIGGPLGAKKASFFLDFQRREIDDNAIINATRLDNNLVPYQYSAAYPTPHRQTEVSPRVDYAINANNTLVMRYSYEEQRSNFANVGNFTLPSQGYSSVNTENRVQLTETSVLASKIINETRFQFRNERSTQDGANGLFSLTVSQAFNGGGAQVGRSWDTQRNYEVQNYTSIAQGTHALKFGVRIRRVSDDNFSAGNFGGTFTFNGGPGPLLNANNQPLVPGLDCTLSSNRNNPDCPSLTSIERYRRTLLFQQLGYSPALIRQLGGGASQFSINSGNPYLSVPQTDYGLFFMDDWRLRPNITLSLGIRYELQTNIGDHKDIAPRIGIAWAPGTAAKAGRAKTVIRGGTGLFYDRFQEGSVLSAERFNGSNQLNLVATNPDFFPTIPALSTLATSGPLTRRIIDPTLRAPYLAQSAVSIERQLPRNMSVAVTYTNTHTMHMFRSRNINAPLDGTYDPNKPSGPTNGVFPFGYAAGNLINYESSGTLNQNQLTTNVNARVNAKISLNGFYSFSHANGNTDSLGTFPSDQYNLASEYGRSSFDVHHRVFIGGSIATFYDLRFSPFITINSGRPFNITAGRDLNGDSQFTDRPSFAPASACGTSPSIYCTPFGNFNTNPQPGDKLIPRNYGNGPGSFTVNMRLGKTWGFGGDARGRVQTAGGPGGDQGGPGGGGGGDRGGRGGGGGGGGPRGGGGGGGGASFGGGGGGMRGGGGGGGATSQRYNLNLSINARNLFNHVNPGDYSGNLLSPYFGRANSLGGGGFGGGGGGGGGATNNRRIDLSLRFSF